VWAAIAVPHAFLVLVPLGIGLRALSGFLAGRAAHRAPRRALHWSQSWVVLIVYVALLFAGPLAVRMYVVEAFKMSSSGMAPTLEPGDQLYIMKIGRDASLRAGEIVAFDMRGDTFVQRVVAGPGQAFQVSAGRVFVDSIEVGPGAGPLENPPPGNDSAGVVGEGMYFVCGDNRESSYDSRSFGLIRREDVVGVAVSVWWSWGPDGPRLERIRTLR
jgi:signal peptidase I